MQLRNDGFAKSARHLCRFNCRTTTSRRTDDLGGFVDAKPLTLAELEKSGLRRDKWSEAQTSQHNEFYWRLRAWRALSFLFPPGEKVIPQLKPK